MRFLKYPFFLITLISTFIFYGCKENTIDKTKEKTGDCDLYKKSFERLKRQMIESERNADRLENVMYRLTQNHLIIDEKIRLIQKIKGNDNFLKRTASEINNLFSNSHLILDSAEFTIQKSSIPQSSLIPIIEAVKTYLTQQEILFIEIYGNITSIKSQVSKLKNTVKSKEIEIKKKEDEAKNQMAQKEKEGRKIYYLVGSKAELERAKAIKRQGGFLGIGTSVQLSDKLEDMFFQTADYNIMKEIALGNTKKVNLITTHPKGSYLILDTPGERFLKVTNPERFWSASKFLVVEVD